MSENINKAYAQARLIVRRKIAEHAGALYESLSPAGQLKVDQLVEKKGKIVHDVAKKILAKNTLKSHHDSFVKGTPIHNMGQPEGMNEHLNSMFMEYFPQYDTSNALGQKVDVPVAPQSNPVYRDGPKGKSPLIIQYSKFGNEKISDSNTYKALAKKSQKSGVKEEILGAVYDRGIEAWTEETGVTQQQYAFARVNSYINQGKSYFNEDADLHEGREPGTPSVKRYTRNDGVSALKSLSKWGQRKDWRDSIGGHKKAHEHAGLTPEQSGVKPSMKEEITLITKPDGTPVLNCGCRKDPCVTYGTQQEARDKKFEQYVESRQEVHAVARPDDGDRKKIKNVEREPDAKTPKDPKSALTRNAEIQRKIIEAKVGNVQKDPAKRLIGTDSLTKAYVADTPCMKVNEDLNESFNIAYAAGIGVTLTAADLGMRAQGGFAYHPSVIAEMEEVEEDVTSALKQPVYMPARRNADGTFQPAKTVMRKTQKKIVKSGNVHNGDDDSTDAGMGPA